ncbi:MAG: hypothetical protein ACJ8IK_06965 [Burkholderiaceae bacterium]
MTASALLAPNLFGAPAGFAGACNDGETTFFACRLEQSSKVAVLCGHAGPRRSWLQYRFGVPGHPPELLIPSTAEDQEMTSTFFVDGPSGSRDGSWSGIGVWFQNSGATYELRTSQETDDRNQSNTASNILVWPHFLTKRPTSLSCAETSSSEGLTAAGEVIAAIAPEWHGWGVSPEDWSLWAQKRDTARRAAAAAKNGASAAEVVSPTR